MPDTNERREREFAKYEAMSTEELQQLLREDASKPVGEESDTDALFYIMEVLAKRRKERNEGKSAAEALESFKNKYYTETETSSLLLLPESSFFSNSPVITPVKANFLLIALAEKPEPCMVVSPFFIVTMSLRLLVNCSDFPFHRIEPAVTSRFSSKFLILMSSYKVYFSSSEFAESSLQEPSVSISPVFFKS